MPTLFHTQMKMERAKHHLDAFNRDLDAFLGGEPYSVTDEDDLEHGRYIRRFYYKPIPVIIPMRLEEFIYCLRSGLDNLAWQLALLKTDSPSENIAFPIFERAGKQFENRLKPFISPVQDAIRSLQPYRAGDSFHLHPLWQLNKLSNLAKHTVFPLHSQAIPVSFPISAGVFPREFDDQIELNVPMALKKDLQSKPRLPLQIQLGKWGTKFQIPPARLTEIYDFVRDTAIPKFAGFLPEKPGMSLINPVQLR